MSKSPVHNKGVLCSSSSSLKFGHRIACKPRRVTARGQTTRAANRCRRGLVRTDVPKCEASSSTQSDAVGQPALKPPTGPSSSSGPSRTEPVNGDALELEDFLGLDGGPPRFFSPLISSVPENHSTLPLLLYLPGIDGTGLGASSQFDSLGQLFDLQCMAVPVPDRSSVSELVACAARHLAADAAARAAAGLPARAVYVLGESFGGILALALAARWPDRVQRVVVVNPATSYRQTPWPTVAPLLTQLPPQLYDLLPYALSPILGDPVRMARNAVEAEVAAAEAAVGSSWLRPPWEVAGEVAEVAAAAAARLGPAVQRLGVLSRIIPPATLAQKLSLLQEGAEQVEQELGAVRARVLVVAGGSDRLLPSAQEAQRLKQALPRGACVVETVEGSSHQVLQEGAVQLAQIMQRRSFYDPCAGLQAPPDAEPARPMALPSAAAIERAASGPLQALRQVASPVFLSTGPSGERQLGLGAVPNTRPLLFVGNHQTLAPDVGLIVEQFLREKKMLLRGLTHPFVFQQPPPPPQADSGAASTSGRGMSETFTQFGAVPVSGRNLYKLLAGGQAALLFPGGVREAYKERGENYRLFWPDRPEFVRMAIRHGATIVPFSAIGAEDGEILLNGSELAALPVLGPALRQRADPVPAARASADPREAGEGGRAETFIPPVQAPGLPSRYYFLFGRPMSTEGMYEAGALDDAEAVGALYRAVQAEVEEGIQFLLRKREADPYKELGMRLLYEASWGGEKRAPTFKL